MSAEKQPDKQMPDLKDKPLDADQAQQVKGGAPPKQSSIKIKFD